MQYTLLETTRRQTVMQYSVRGLMLVTLAVAIACAVLFPLIKRWNLSAWQVGWTFGCATFGALITLSFRCWRRWKLEQQCGKLLLTIATKSGWALYSFIGMGFIVGPIFILMDLWQHSRHPTPNYFNYFTLNSIWGGAYIAGSFLAIWWKNLALASELCENGVITGSISFIPWNDFRGYRRSVDNSIQLLMKHNFISFRLPAELEPQLLEILDAHVPKRG